MARKLLQRPRGRIRKNFRPWILALVVMIFVALGLSIYEAQNSGGYFWRLFNKDRNRYGKDAYVVAMNAAVPGAAKDLQTSYHGIIEDAKSAVISIDAVFQAQTANPGDATANFARIGSGVIIDPRGYALSSLHVVEGASSMKATVYSQAGALEYPLKIVKATRALIWSFCGYRGTGLSPCQPG